MYKKQQHIKSSLSFLAAIFLFLLLGFNCFSGNSQTVPSDSKTLIVYLSRTQNTKAVAEIIHKNLGGTLVALELEKLYFENYKAQVGQVMNENETGFLPPLKTKIENMEQYSVVFLGFPTWGMQLPPPIKRFLKQYNFTGKTIVPFNTNAGYGIGSSFEIIKNLWHNSKILEGFCTVSGKEKDGIFFLMKGEKEKMVQTEVKNWLKKIMIQNNSIKIHD